MFVSLAASNQRSRGSYKGNERRGGCPSKKGGSGGSSCSEIDGNRERRKTESSNSKMIGS